MFLTQRQTGKRVPPSVFNQYAIAISYLLILRGENVSSNRITVYQRLLGYLRPYWPQVILAYTAMLFATPTKPSSPPNCKKRHRQRSRRWRSLRPIHRRRHHLRHRLHTWSWRLWSTIPGRMAHPPCRLRPTQSLL